MIVNLRAIAEPDYPRLAEIFRAAFLQIGEDWSLDGATEHITEFNEEAESFCFLAELDGETVGFILAYVANTSGGREMNIDTIAVDPAYQKHGVGRSLFEQAKKYAVENNLIGISLLTHPKAPSYQWYKKMGMKENGWVEVFLEL